SDTREFHEFTGEIAAGGVAAGASFTRLEVTGGASAAVDANAQIGQGSDNVGSLDVLANSILTAELKTLGVSAGIFGLTANFAYVTVTPTIEASSGTDADGHVTGQVQVAASLTDTISAKVLGDAFGLAAGGMSLTNVDV